MLVRHPSALELRLPDGEHVDDGEWVLAVFELGEARRATSAAACGARSPEEVRVVFEPRDWQRLAQFVEAELERQASDANLATQADLSTDSRPATASPRVLLVDDDDDIRAVVTTMLEASDLRVTPAGSAEEALSRLTDARFDLVILDWNLPTMSGLDLCRTLRLCPKAGQTPVLFLTANACSTDMVEAFACGADDYLVKPFRAPELSARIFSLLRRAASP
jgi:two-component system phosphate regulon response regulator PhoB